MSPLALIAIWLAVVFGATAISFLTGYLHDRAQRRHFEDCMEAAKEAAAGSTFPDHLSELLGGPRR